MVGTWEVSGGRNGFAPGAVLGDGAGIGSRPFGCVVVAGGDGVDAIVGVELDVAVGVALEVEIGVTLDVGVASGISVGGEGARGVAAATR